MTTPPEMPASTSAPARSKTTVLIAITGVVVLAVSLVMAYRERKNTGTASLPQAVNSGSQKSLFTFNILPQPRALPMLRFTDEKERAMTLQDFRGRFLLLNVWATWCVPCRKEMPTLDRLQINLGGADFEVIALSIDQGGTSVVRPFYDEIGVRNLRIYIDKSGDAMSGLGIAAIPATLLIDREGREIGRKIGPAEWDSPEIIALIRAYIAPPASNLPEKMMEKESRR